MNNAIQGTGEKIYYEQGMIKLQFAKYRNLFEKGESDRYETHPYVVLICSQNKSIFVRLIYFDDKLLVLSQNTKDIHCNYICSSKSTL